MSKKPRQPEPRLTTGHAREPTARDRFMAYVDGWTDGAGVRVIRQEYIQAGELTEFYNEGWIDGRKARRAMAKKAEARFRYQESVIATAGNEGG